MNTLRAGCFVLFSLWAITLFGCNRSAPPSAPESKPKKPVVAEMFGVIEKPPPMKKESLPKFEKPQDVLPTEEKPLISPPPRDARVAVVAPLHVRTRDAQDSQLGELLGEILAVALAEQKNVAVVERRKLNLVLQEQKLTLAGLVEPATAAKVGKLLLAEIVVAGSVIEMEEGKLRYVVHLIAVDGQRVVGSVQVDGTRKDFERSALELSAKLSALAGGKLPQVKPEELDDSPVGRLHLMRGIGFYHAGNHDQAIVSFLRAVQLDPRLQEARLWIARAYLRQGEKDHARTELQMLARNPTAQPLAEQIQQLLAECGPAPAGKDQLPRGEKQ